MAQCFRINIFTIFHDRIKGASICENYHSMLLCQNGGNMRSILFSSPAYVFCSVDGMVIGTILNTNTKNGNRATETNSLSRRTETPLTSNYATSWLQKLQLLLKRRRVGLLEIHVGARNITVSRNTNGIILLNLQVVCFILWLSRPGYHYRRVRNAHNLRIIY